MSICPDKDLYSAYVDGELQSPWKEKLEAHFEECSRCQKILDNYRQLKSIIFNSGNPKLDIETSFLKLKNKKILIDIENETNEEVKLSSKNWFYTSIKVPLPIIAAAAVFLVIFTPILMININKVKASEQIAVSNFEPILPVTAKINYQKQKFNLKNLKILPLSSIKSLEKKEKQKITFNQFMNLYVPVNLSDNEPLYSFQDVNNNNVFSQVKFMKSDFFNTNNE